MSALGSTGVSLSRVVLQCLALVLVCVCVRAADGELQVKAGYVIADEEGNLSVDQTSYNIHDGIALSIEDFRYSLSPNWGLTADLRNFTLDNRDLSASLRSQGKFSLGLNHKQYRRRYDFEGGIASRRAVTDGRISVFPVKRMQLFGSFAVTKKTGEFADALDITEDQTDVDYRHTSVEFGGRFIDKRGSVSVSYGHADFKDKLSDININSDRQSDRLRTSAALYVPGADWLLVSGGYDYRTDELKSGIADLTTNLGWAGMKAELPYDLFLEYRFAFARTDQSRYKNATDNVTNAASLSRAWRGIGGLLVGYENRISDDLVDRTESHGIQLGGWYIFRQRLTLRATMYFRDQDVVTGETMIGDRSISRHKISARYRVPELGNFELQWLSRVSKHDPVPGLRDDPVLAEVESRVSYDVVTASANAQIAELGSATVSHSYYLGQYQNNSSATAYEFSDHLFQTTVTPRSVHNLQVTGRGYYYRSRRDKDLERFGVGVTATCAIREGYLVGVEYDALNYDDFRNLDRYYTGNIVRLYVKKDLSF